MNLYRARYEWPETSAYAGRTSWVSFTSLPHDALAWAAAYVKAFTGGYLLALREERPLTVARPQLSLL
jgi:hypothetical protein